MVVFSGDHPLQYNYQLHDYGELRCGVRCGDGTSSTITNCIVWDNGRSIGLNHDEVEATVVYSCVQREDPWLCAILPRCG